MKDKYFLEKSFITMEVLDDSNLPVHYASGCIVNYKNDIYILTLEHAVKDNFFLFKKAVAT